MGLLETPAAALAWIGRQGTRAVALSVFAGLALPWLAAAAKPAFTVSTGSRNLGLMIAAAGGAVPELTWLYVAMAQFPIYLRPYLLTPVLTRFKE
jgi:BASS family bile acid:Na+ symporter